MPHRPVEMIANLDTFNLAGRSADVRLVRELAEESAYTGKPPAPPGGPWLTSAAGWGGVLSRVVVRWR